MLQITGMDATDRKEFETVVKYLEQKCEDLAKNKKDRTPDSPKQLLQMTNTIKRALVLANES